MIKFYFFKEYYGGNSIPTISGISGTTTGSILPPRRRKYA